MHVDHWSMNYVFDDVCTIRIKMTNNKWINVYNVYNVSFNFYTTRNALIVIKIVKNCLNDDEKHILLKNFYLHHSLWNDAIKSIQHDATNQFLNVVQQTQFKFIKHYHLKNASFLKHDRFDIHNEEVTKRIYTLHDEIENESKFESYFNIHKIDVNRKKKRITTSSSMKKHV